VPPLNLELSKPPSNTKSKAKNNNNDSKNDDNSKKNDNNGDDDDELRAAAEFHTQLVAHKQQQPRTIGDRTQSFRTLDKISAMISEFSRDIDE
jgi:hypothetical protein